MSIERGQIYFVNLNPVLGREQAGKRPVLVLFINAVKELPLVVTVVIETKGTNIKHDYPTNIRVFPSDSRLLIETVFLYFQIRSLDPNRFPADPSGKISDSKMLEVETAVRYCLGL
ncbi:type II toxin-antitoxin system PemK/MazF family toxin [Nostoc sp. MG11]|uniref:type II toxin-antitoxin system PemK/MazF family toxin n=1 Tax=Nostoc sp. MG11 TaxID=2721166 RepID=UPI00186701E8|nr:type II toxin-antitoxin system PemK/MazF family toxin [Nostoc sp. MG11]